MFGALCADSDRQIVSMKRIHMIAKRAALLLAFWLAALQLAPPQLRATVLLVSTAPQQPDIMFDISIGHVLMRTASAFQFPVMALVAFGLYMLALLLHGTCTFRSCPEEAAALHEVGSADWPSSFDAALKNHIGHVCSLLCRTYPGLGLRWWRKATISIQVPAAVAQ